MRLFPALLRGVGLVALLTMPAPAAEFTMRMYDTTYVAPMLFEPAVLHIAPGDTVTFQPTSHQQNAESIPGLLPAGATPFAGAMNEPVTVTFDVPGAYGITSHSRFRIGMVALVVVGETPSDLAAFTAPKLPNRARERFAALLRQVDEN